ncbi:MAG: hypothetical protein SynsKO_17810 [Synoicihabitans sp.]
MRIFTRFLILSALLSATTGVSYAQSQEIWTPLHAKALEAPVPLRPSATSVAWPVLGRQVSFRQGSRMAVWDELPIRYQTLTGGGLEIQFPIESMEQWSAAAEPSSRYPYVLSYKFDDASTVGITAVRPASFLTSLDDVHWNRYLGSLGRLPNARVITNDDSQSNANMLRILDGRTRVLEYRYTDKDNDDTEFAVVQIFSQRESGPILIFTLECLADRVGFVGPEFDVLVTSFEFPDDT